MINRSDYNWGVPEVESIEKYGDGGLYPVHIDDRFQDGRYQILNKLGFGSFSTVWAAWDHRNKSRVSLKVIRAENSENNLELRILQRIQQGTTQHPGHKYLPRLLDHFYEGSAERRNLFLVLELLGPNVNDVMRFRPKQRFNLSSSCRRISKQLLLAVDCLHSLGIVHGDIYLRNILYRLPDNNELNLTEVIKGGVSRKDGAPLEEGLPRYLVEPLDLTRQRKRLEFEKLNHIQLIDFSSSFFESEPPESIYTPIPFSPPELIFGKPLDKKIDIWNLGCTTFSIATGGDLFIEWFDKRHIIPQIYDVIGESSAPWLLSAIFDAVQNQDWKDLPVVTDEKLSLYFDSGHSAITSKKEKRRVGALKRYLRKALIPDPSKRPATEELLADGWVQIEAD
ncbi:kinase-like protein [Trematosphaeria pertusa]|uniref:Kinase-like protein n=1 Tax=Trematosphaeria pertusa TaxID=390896 RepID=A0A6A6HWL4_9PLEO|nr:kinase-like protein [Trematosphaeria pertusa]KAF2241780.1 kinase-like protein [Trematosphaeria pertusa]